MTQIEKAFESGVEVGRALSASTAVEIARDAILLIPIADRADGEKVHESVVRELERYARKKWGEV